MKKALYFVLGLAVPLVTVLICRKTDFCHAENTKKHLDRLQEIAVQDSFPASDPPATW